jgi:hypothetical protein
VERIKVRVALALEPDHSQVRRVDIFFGAVFGTPR